MSEEPPKVALFLSDAEIQEQGKILVWRRGLTDVSGSIFHKIRPTVNFPTIFNHSLKERNSKVLPFMYKTALKKYTDVKPKIVIPNDNHDPPYAPVTP
jgi:hypothetical protein